MRTVRICPVCNASIEGSLEEFKTHRKTHKPDKVELNIIERVRADKAHARKKKIKQTKAEKIRELEIRLRQTQAALVSHKKTIGMLDSKVVELDFYRSRPWRNLRWDVIRDHIRKNGKKCLVCDRKNVPLHVDHIIPRSKARHLELDRSNLQVLCEDCNMGKGNRDQTDFR